MRFSEIQKMQKLKLAFLFVIVSMYSACATTSDEVDLLNKSFMLYEHAIRWQDYDVLVAFHKNEDDKLSDVRRKFLKQFRISGYDVVYTKVSSDERTASQVVEVKYYNEAYNVEREMTLNNEWVYDEKRQVWQLTNMLPDFN